MPLFTIFRPHYRLIPDPRKEMPMVDISLEPAGTVLAPCSSSAIVNAKALGHFAPILAPSTQAQASPPPSPFPLSKRKTS